MGSKDDEEVVELTATGVAVEQPGASRATDYSLGRTWRDKYEDWKLQRYKLPRYHKLDTDKDARKHSLWSVNFIILASAVNTKMLNPNFAIMCTPNASDESFSNTDPFGFNSATYFLPLCTLIGVAISSVFIGGWSDRFGRKIFLLILGWISAAGSIVKYFTRHTFWGFCASNFAFGFFLGNLPVGMAYAGDIEPNKMKKDRMLGAMVGFFVLGNSGGGIIAVLMADVGLFAPLWVGAGLMVIAVIMCHKYTIEPGDKRLELEVDLKLSLDDEEDIVQRPETIHRLTLWNIVGGALLDNIGSTGLFPLCLSPLAIEEYYSQFVNKEPPEEPIMTIQAYQWLSVCVALLVIPSTQITPLSFEKLGVAGTCVFGNAATAVVTGLLLLIGNLPSTDLTFGLFVFVMYAGFPFTVFSQLTTGPMLDVIAPEDQIGYVQGLNNSSMNFGMALAPWAFGVLADYAGTNAAIWTGIAFSIAAAGVNSILMWHPLMGKPKPKTPLAQRKLPGEDEELFQKILDGEVVEAELAFRINQDRGLHGKPSVVPRVKPYDEEKDNLRDIAKGAAETFRFRMELYDRALAGLAMEDSDPDHMMFNKEELVELLNTLKGDDDKLADKATGDLGQWMGQYLADNGYMPHNSSVIMKQMFMASFPPLARGNEISEDNIEEILMRTRQVFSRYVEQERTYSARVALAESPWMHGSGWW